METQLQPIEPQNARERELRDRAVRDYAALTAVGLETGRTFFAPGTEAKVALESGRISQARKVFTELPDGHEALTALNDAVVREDRQDMPIEFGELMVSGYGGWVAKGNLYAPTERAAQAVMSMRPSEHPAPPLDFLAWRKDVPSDKELVLRNRKLPLHRAATYPTPDTRECYAVVSPKYVPYDLDAAANDLKEVVPAGSRARVRYDGQRATLDIILQNPYRLADGSGDAAAVGETHRIVMRVKTADDGSGGYHVSLLAERVRCINLTLLHAKKNMFSGTHRQDNLRSLAQDALNSTGDIMKEFSARWEAGWHDYYADKYSGTVSGEEAIRRLVAWGKYRIPGLGKEGTLNACLSALAEEPGNSKLHVHNALTRAAHAAPVTWATRWADDSAEEQASALLYQTVKWLPEVVDEAGN